MKILILLTTLSTILLADFSGMNSGARSLGMGGAYTALANDATAIFHNPAGLARINSINIFSSRQKLYGISNLYSDMIALALPTPYLRTGVAIQQINLVGTYSEKIIYFSSAGIIWTLNRPLRFGFSLKYENAHVKNYDNADSPTNFDFDMGIIYDINKNLFLGYSGKYLAKPEFQFINKKDSIEPVHTIGLCYKWKNSVNFLIDRSIAKNNTLWHFGTELWFYDVFASRLGMFDENLTIGFGIKSNLWILDIAIVSHEDLGSTYRFSLGIKSKTNE